MTSGLEMRACVYSYSSGTPSHADPCKSCAYCLHFCEFICALRIGGEGLSTLSTGDGGGRVREEGETTTGVPLQSWNEPGAVGLEEGGDR